jgi:hypothetical protein
MSGIVVGRVMLMTGLRAAAQQLGHGCRAQQDEGELANLG